MYLHSAAVFSPIYKAAREGAYVERHRQGFGPPDCVREEQDCWMAQTLPLRTSNF